MALQHSLLLPIGLVLFLLAVDAAVTMGLVSTMVAFLHSDGKGPFPFTPPNGSHLLILAGEPTNLVVNQGHTTNAAGGTALILVGFGGSIALWLERRSRKKWDHSSPFFHLWSLLVLLSWLLTTGALIYTFVETSHTSGQSIDVAAVRDLAGSTTHYPYGRWTPENWYAAVLELPLQDATQRRALRGEMTVMRGWRWNLVPMFVLGFGLLVLVVLEQVRVRRRGAQNVSMTEVLAEPFEKVSA
ncbi:hypothetical protein B0J18DRAFT_445129 [Chaetomium sp. MPI-SDFR-AT-0129]|nr:hypothetical protein B0J18DRAFT_445129 [Chaetomium sp. MPI-SDFR-AT-0129]